VANEEHEEVGSSTSHGHWTDISRCGTENRNG